MKEISIITCMTIIYYILAFSFSLIIDKLTCDISEKKEQEKQLLFSFIEIILHICLICVISYFVRNIVENIIYPLLCD